MIARRKTSDGTNNCFSLFHENNEKANQSEKGDSESISS
jgi:hypothetical protein